MSEPESVFSAKLPRFAPPPTDAPAVRVRDVIICPTGGADSDPEEFRAHPPVGSPMLRRERGTANPVALGRGVSVHRLPDDEAELVMNACTPRGHHFSPIRQFGQRFSFIRELDLDRSEHRAHGWDEDGVLWDCLSLSRLVRDNAFSTQYAARIIDYEDGEQQVIYALGYESQHAYRFRRDRDWPDEAEAAELRDLVARYWACADALPPRVRRAMWRAEYSCWLRWADLALPIITSGLESLLKTERHRATWQLETRVPALADELSVTGISSALCEDVYDARSEWVHGTHVRLFATGTRDGNAAERMSEEQMRSLATLARFQDLLRAAVRLAVEDEKFRAIFESDDAITERWADGRATS